MSRFNISSEAFLAKYELTKENYLLNACRVGDISLVTELLSSGLSIDCHNEKSHTPLIVAVYSNQHTMVQYLLDSKADPNLTEKYSGSSPLHKAAMYNNDQIMLLLLAKGAVANVHNKPPNRDTPLHIAVRAKYLPCIRLLLWAGADPYSVNDDGFHPISLASKGVHKHIASEYVKVKMRIHPKPWESVI